MGKIDNNYIFDCGCKYKYNSEEYIIETSYMQIYCEKCKKYQS